jgi:ADP-ribosylglycohydrolase
LDFAAALRAPPSIQDRAVAVVLGAAIGDAMGHPTEFVTSFEAIRRRWPPDGVRGFELYWERGPRRFAPYTDDTQMAEVVLRSLADGRAERAGFDATMRSMAAGFVRWSQEPQGGHRSPGGACLRGCSALARGVPWSEAGGPDDGGCGSVMRCYPFGLRFADDPDEALRQAVAHSAMTHRAPIALAACAAMVRGVALAVAGEPRDAIVCATVEAARAEDRATAAMIQRAAAEASGGAPPEVTLQRLGGWAAHEAIAAGVYVFARHPDDFEAAVLEAANTPGDSDSIATLAGALVAARVGIGGLPTAWVADVERSEELARLAVRLG